MTEPCAHCGGVNLAAVVCKRPGCGEVTGWECVDCGDLTSALNCHYHGDED